jgi:two-component system, NtrC family, nitrogen regulation sensor histidine kinase GlnL
MTKNAAQSLAPIGAQRLPPQGIDYEVLLSALPHPIVVVGQSNHVVFANAAAEVFLSTSLAMMRRESLDTVLAFGCPLLALIDQVRRSQSTVNEYGIEMMTQKFSAAKLVDVHAGPLPDHAGHVILMLQQRTMAQMIERQLTHRAAARTVSGMAAVLAHEIKNPLSGIRGAAQLLEPGLSDEDRGLAQLICSETERIRKLVDRMEVFGDERPLATEPVNIHDVLNHVRRLSETGFARGLRFVEDYDPSLPSVPANRDKLVQAFLNLVKNAAEAIGDDPRDQGRITITTAFKPGMRLSVPGSDARVSLPLMIQIEDNGGGVPDHLKPHLFDPFVTTKRNGTGLGLALVAKIIGDHGGIIELDSEPNRTVFRVLLPLQERARKPSPMPIAKPSEAKPPK